MGATNTPSPERSPRILVIDDEEQIRRALRSVLQARHYVVDVAATGGQGLEAAVDRTPDLVVLDLTLPDMSGLQVAEELRAWYHGPIIVLSVRDADADKIAALDLGADDYLTKPFSSGELLARIRAHLRRTSGVESSVREIVAGDLAIDLAKRMVTVAGEPVHLTRTEFDILALLARNADRVVTSRMLLEQVWGPEYETDTQALRVHVSHLRQKIEPAGGVPRHILTEPGVGFRFVGD
jgi:two-component system, OmpR family, KDP operon response regulator KdpE